MKKYYISTLLFYLLITYNIQSQNKRPAYLGKPSYATFGIGRFFDQSVFLRFGYEQRVRNHFGVEAYVAPSLPLGISSQFRMLHHFGIISSSNYTNFDPYLGGSFGGKFTSDDGSTGIYGLFSGFRLMPKPEYGFFVESGINYTGSKRFEYVYEVYVQIGICRKFLNKKPI